LTLGDDEEAGELLGELKEEEANIVGEVVLELTSGGLIAPSRCRRGDIIILAEEELELLALVNVVGLEIPKGTGPAEWELSICCRAKNISSWSPPLVVAASSVALRLSTLAALLRSSL